MQPFFQYCAMVLGRPRRSCSGFTYIEALAALLLTSTLTLGIVMSQSVIQGNLTYSLKSVQASEQAELVRVLASRAMDMSEDILVTPYLGAGFSWSHIFVEGNTPRSDFADVTPALLRQVNAGMQVEGDNTYNALDYNAGFSIWFVSSSDDVLARLNIYRLSGTDTLRTEAMVAGSSGSLLSLSEADLDSSDVRLVQYDVSYAGASNAPYRDDVSPVTFYLDRAVLRPYNLSTVSSFLLNLPSPYDLDAAESYVLFSPQALFVEHANSILIYTKDASEN